MISQVRRLTIALRSIIRCGRRSSRAAAGTIRRPEVSVAAVSLLQPRRERAPAHDVAGDGVGQQHGDVDGGGRRSSVPSTAPRVSSTPWYSGVT